jgi:hypothetical protein
MSRKFFQTVGMVVPFLILFLLADCGQKEPDLGKEVLIRVGDRVMTVLDFNNAFEIAKIAYDNNISQHPEELRSAQVRLLHELTVEMILLERAKVLAISVSDAELEKAVSEIKSDYPEGEFEKTLLEFAVSYDSWKTRLKNRLIMEKVIDEELKSRISITAEDIAAYYRENFQGRETESDAAQPSENITEAIVKQLRRQKAEATYNSWIEELKSKYQIEINSEQWEKITGLKTTGTKENNALGNVSPND